MHFNKQTLRALIAITCLSVSATTLQASWLDWFRCGKRSTPAATESTVKTATPVAVTATHVEADCKERKIPKVPHVAQSAVIVAPSATQPQKGRVQRFFDWLETKLSNAISIHKLSESAAVAKVSAALAPAFDLSDCPSLKHYLEKGIAVEELPALRQYLAWQDYYRWERAHGTKQKVYFDIDTDGTPIKREITTRQIMTPRKGIIIAIWATHRQNPDGNWQCLEHDNGIVQRNVDGRDLIRNVTEFIQGPESKFSKLKSILANAWGLHWRLQIKWNKLLAILAIIESMYTILVPTQIVNSFSPYSPQCPYPPQPFTQPQCHDIKHYTGAVDLKGMQKNYPIDIAYDADDAPCRVFQVWYNGQLQADITTCCATSSATEIECFSHNAVANRLVQGTIPLKKPVDVSLAFAPPKPLAKPNSRNYNNDTLSMCCVNDAHFIHQQKPHYVEIVPKEILTEIQPFLAYLERNADPTDARWMAIFKSLGKLSLPILIECVL